MPPTQEFPATLARGSLRVLPPRLLDQAIRVLLRRMARHHRDLFAELRALRPTGILVSPTDLPHRFLLRFGGGPLTLTLQRCEAPADAELKGSFAALLALLEGQTDGDVLFFTRRLSITGRSDAVVELRNVLERAEIDVLEDVAALFGPLRGPARQALLRLDRVAQRVRDRLLPAPPPPEPPASLLAERDRLRVELAGVKARMAKMEQRQRRRVGTAST